MNPARHQPSFQRNLKRHQATARKLWQNFVVVAERAIRWGVDCRHRVAQIVQVLEVARRAAFH